jgi:hypothetical protein
MCCELCLGLRVRTQKYIAKKKQIFRPAEERGESKVYWDNSIEPNYANTI